jgi:hypothetical protein
MRQAGEEAVEEFLKIVESGATPNITNPARLLRERLLTDDTLRRAVREVVIERFALFIKAWNMWRAGSRPSKLSWRGFGEKSNEEFPIIEGVNLKAKPPRH